jgi:hypothetical protein
MSEPFVVVDGVLQVQDGVIHVQAQSIQPLMAVAVKMRSHDFH